MYVCMDACMYVWTQHISFCKLDFTCYRKLNLFIKVHKDPIPIIARPNVYKINCLECNASYVGQTKRTLNTRINEHRNHIRRDSVQSSVIRRHGSVSGVKYIERYTTPEKLPCIFTRAGEKGAPEIFVSKKRLNRSNSK